MGPPGIAAFGLSDGTTPSSGNSEALHRVVLDGEQVGHLLIALAEVILDHAQFFHRPSRFSCGSSKPERVRLGRRAVGPPAAGSSSAKTAEIRTVSCDERFWLGYHERRPPTTPHA